jgi:hypothetical protein
MSKPSSTPVIYDGGTNKREYANWKRQIEAFNASQDYIFSARASNRERPTQSQQIQLLINNRRHNWTHQETAAKQKVEQTKREWNERMQISVDHLKSAIGPNIKAGLQDFWHLTSSDQDADFTFRDIFRRIEHDHGPTQTDTAKSRRQIMAEVMDIPPAQHDQEVQKSFNKLTSLCFELENIQAEPMSFNELKEISTTMLTKECFQQDRTLINSSGHRRPRNLSDIIQIWRRCAEEIRQYTGRTSSFSKIAAAKATEETEQWSDEEEETSFVPETSVAAFQSRPPYSAKAGQPSYPDSRSYYDSKNTRPSENQQQRPPSRPRTAEQTYQQQRPPPRPRTAEPTPGQSKLITRLQETDSFKTAEIDFLRFQDLQHRRQIQELQQQVQLSNQQQQFQQPTSMLPFQQTVQQQQHLPPPLVLHQQQQQTQQAFQRPFQRQPYDNSKRRYAQAFTIEEFTKGDFSNPTYRPITKSEDEPEPDPSDPSHGYWDRSHG